MTAGRQVDECVAGDGGPRPSATGLQLGAAAAQLYGDLRLRSVLAQLLQQSELLLDALGGSVSVVDSAHSRYWKAAERGAACRLGGTFSLDEGITGQVARRRSPVVLPRYSDVPAGHLPVEHPACAGAVVAVPIWWRGEVLAVNVVFAGRARPFTGAQVDQLELLSQVPAAAIVACAPAEPVLADLLPHTSALRTPAAAPLVVVTEVGAPQHRHPATSRTAEEMVALLHRVADGDQPPGHLRVVLLHQSDRLRVVVHDDAPARSGGRPSRPCPSDSLAEQAWQAWAELVGIHGGSLDVEEVPGWGVLVLADLPHHPPPRRTSPLSRRQQDVLRLLAQGLTDRQVAQRLVLAPKTVEKHVSAVLRLTAASSRTGAVVRAIEQGWLLPSGPSPVP